MSKSQQNAERPFGFMDKFAYMMGDVGCNSVLTLANSYLLVFSTKVMGISAGVVGTLFMLARFVDAVTDMAVGRMVDQHTAKNGDRYRPWIAIGSLPMVIASCLMYDFWFADASMGLKIGWLIVTYILFGSICYTAVNIPYGVMSNLITNDPTERTSLSTWRSVGSILGATALGIVIPLVVYTQDADGNDVANGPRFFMAAVVLGIVALICLYICCFGSRERIRVPNKGKEEKGDSFHSILLCLKDRTVVTNIGYSVFVYAASTAFSTFTQFLFLDYFGNTSMAGVSSLIMMIAMVIAAPVVTIFGQKYGKKEISVVGLSFSSVSYLILFLMRPDSVIIYFCVVFIAFLGLGIITMALFAMVNDTIDNHFLITGDQVGGTVYALNSFMRKMAAALCTGLSGWGLTWIGYDELATVQTEAVRQGIFNISIGLPLIFFICALVFVFLYPLNKQRTDENNAKMMELRKEQQQE